MEAQIIITKKTLDQIENLTRSILMALGDKNPKVPYASSKPDANMEMRDANSIARQLLNYITVF